MYRKPDKWQLTAQELKSLNQVYVAHTLLQRGLATIGIGCFTRCGLPIQVIGRMARGGRYRVQLPDGSVEPRKYQDCWLIYNIAPGVYRAR